MQRMLTFLLVIFMLYSCTKVNSLPSDQTKTAVVSYSVTRSTDGNSYDTFYFPPFDSTLGKLYGVSLSMVITTVHFSFTLENHEDSTFRYLVVLGSKDFLSLGGNQNLRVDSQTLALNYTLGPSDNQPGLGADYIAVSQLEILHALTFSDSIPYAQLFNSEGNVAVYHQSSTFGYTLNGVRFTLRGSASDQLVMTLQYHYLAKAG